MLLNGGQAADALVIGERLVVGRDQTHGILRAEILQDLQADVAVEQHIGPPVPLLAGDHQRFDQADVTARTKKLWRRSVYICVRFWSMPPVV